MRSLALVVAVAACGGGNNSSPDAPSPIDAQTCIALSSYTATPGSAMATDDDAAGSSGSNQESLAYIGYYDATTQLAITLYAFSQDYPGSDVAPETDVDLSANGDDQDSTCGSCVVLFAGIESDGTASETYLATSGTITVTSTTGNFTGTLTDVALTHVTIDAASGDSTPVEDGCASSIPSLAFSAPIIEASARARTRVHASHNDSPL